MPVPIAGDLQVTGTCGSHELCAGRSVVVSFSSKMQIINSTDSPVFHFKVKWQSIL